LTLTYSTHPSPPKQEEVDPRVEMLEATLPFISEYGFSMESLVRGAKSLGYPSVAHGIFPGGEAGLIDAYLAYSRELFVDAVKQKLINGELEG
jgi:ubiquinone biosynthesis protein COQ9